MTSDHASSPHRPWPRFTRLPEPRAPREHAPYEPWPRWGWFPREQRTWSFAPGPSLTASPSPVPPAPDVGPASEPTRPAPPPPSLPPPREAPPAIEDIAGVTEDGPELDLLPVRRSTSMALVPARAGEVTLGELARAAKRVAPVAAIAGMAAAAAVALFRRR